MQSKPLPSSQLTIVCIGNPGVGKSTLLNLLHGQAIFESGISLATGLTSVIQVYLAPNGVYYIDTPGLSDIKRREQAAEEIKKALVRGGRFKVFFVITLEAGRIKPDDKTTMKLVLKAAPAIGSQYSVIVNKIKPKTFELLKKENDMFYALLGNGLPSKPHEMFIFPHEDKLSEEDNAIATVNEEFVSFINKAPTIEIEPTSVKNIDLSEFDEIKRQFEEQIRILMEDCAAKKRAIERDQQEHREEMKRLHQKLDVQREEYDAKWKKELEEYKQNNQSNNNSAPNIEVQPKQEGQGLFGTIMKFIGSVAIAALVPKVGIPIIAGYGLKRSQN